MKDRTERLQLRGDGIGTAEPPVTNGNGSAPAKSPVETADPVRHRQDRPAANFRLAVLALLIVMVGAGAGYAGSLLLPKQYAARAQVYYSLSQSVPNELLREDRMLTTQLVLLRSRVVLEPVAVDNGMRAEDLAENVSAEVVDGSQIIQIEVRDRSRARAQALLSAVVDRYLTEANKDWRDPVQSFVETQVMEMESQLRDVQTRLQDPGLAGSDAAALAQREQILNSLVDPLRLKLSTDQKAPSGPPARVLTPPYLVAGQVGPTPWLAAASGAATALLVAGFVVLVVARRRLRS